MLHTKLTAAVIATAAALVMAPAVGAHKPYREPLELSSGVLEDCPFDVQVEANGGKEFMTIYDSGRFTIHARINPTVTNVETEESKSYRLAYLFSETFDADANVFLGQLTGRFLFSLLPGDVGPSGEVDPDGGFVHVVGQMRYTMDAETGAITSMTVRGTTTDVCALLG